MIRELVEGIREDLVVFIYSVLSYMLSFVFSNFKNFPASIPRSLGMVSRAVKLMATSARRLKSSASQ